MRKALSVAGKFFSLLNLAVCVCRGEGVELAVVTFNANWN